MPVKANTLFNSCFNKIENSTKIGVVVNWEFIGLLFKVIISIDLAIIYFNKRVLVF